MGTALLFTRVGKPGRFADTGFSCFLECSMNRSAFSDRDRSPPLPVVTVCIAALAALAAMSDMVQQWLEFDRAAIGHWQLWRIVTGHMVHWNTDHFVWDALMFGVLGCICEQSDRRRFVGCLLGSAAAISAAIIWLLPGTNLYRGLSGVDSALFILACVEWMCDAWQKRDFAFLAVVVLAVLGFMAKLVYEVCTGATLFVDSTGAGFVPLPLVHGVGAIVGAAAALTPFLGMRQSPHHRIKWKRVAAR
jgi:rhomboid family GlyGly-CTERM serine protease